MTASRGRVRLTDVAKLAGVSAKTASNVLNGEGRYSTRTADAVHAAVAKLGYRPNVSARNLRRGRTGLIALVVPEIAVDYFSEISTHVLAAAADQGMSVVVEQTLADVNRELELLDGMRGALVDGVILSPLQTTEAHLRSITQGPPFVLLGEEMEAGVTDHVGFDNVAAAGLAVRHLLELGRSRIGAVGTHPIVAPGERRERMRTQREKGLAQALTEAGLSVDPALLEPTDNVHYRDGAEGMRKLLERADPRPDGVFCFNDLVALGAMRTVHDFGLHIPEDIAIIGFDGLEQGKYSTPRLSTIAPDKKALAESAVRALRERIADRQTPAREIEVGLQLIARESTIGR